MPNPALQQLIAAAFEALAGEGPPPLPIAREGADTRARIPVTIPQAAGPDGAARGVWVRALSGRQRQDAETAAHRVALRAMGPAPAQAQSREPYFYAYDRIFERRLVIEEVARMLVEPPDIPVATVEEWGDAVIQSIHLAGISAEGYPAEFLAQEFARLHGRPVPPAEVAGPPQPADEPVAGAAE